MATPVTHTAGLRVAVVGSRDYPSRKQVRKVVNKLPEGTVVISGGARGVDTWAEKAARKRGLEVVVYLPDWGGKHGRGAGYARNKLIIGDADRVIAFHHNGSKGTAHSIKLATKAGKPLEVYTKKGKS